MPTVQELEQSLLKAKEAERELKRKQEQEAQTAKLQEELKVTNEYMFELHKTVLAQGIECAVKGGILGGFNGIRYATLIYPDDSAGYKANAQPEIQRRSKAYSSSHSYQIQFGSYGEKKTYPRLKDGTFNYGKIAADLKYFIEQKSRSRAYAEERAANYQVSKQIINRLGAAHQLVTGVTLSGNEGDSSKVKLRVETTCSEAEAGRILDLLAEIEKDRDSAGRN